MKKVLNFLVVGSMQSIILGITLAILVPFKMLFNMGHYFNEVYMSEEAKKMLRILVLQDEIKNKQKELEVLMAK